jgi:acetoacetyl-CoA synthetase
VIELLTQIWEQVFSRSHIGSDENFFDLGGDPLLAAKLFREIEKATGRLLSPLVIYQSPTIALLAAQLEDPRPRPFPAYVLLKPGNSEPPVFLMHGLGGNIAEFFGLIKHLDVSQPVYGLQAPGTDGLEQPYASIEEIAQFYVQSMIKLQPHGPYVVVGYSLGGLVAIEAARILQAAGKDIASLVMIESYPLIRYAPLGQRLVVYARKAKYRIRIMLHTIPDDRYWVQFTPEMQKVEDAARIAQRRHRPAYYPGNIHFFKAAKRLHFPDPQKVWSRFVSGMEIETVPGDHHEIMTTNYQYLAVAISRYLLELKGKSRLSN